MEATKKILRPEICLVYAYFFNHLSLSMLISFMLMKKECTEFGLVKKKKSNNFLNLPHVSLREICWIGTKIDHLVNLELDNIQL